MNISEALITVDDYIKYGEYSPPVREAWQTLKAAILTQQTNNKKSTPCCDVCGGPLRLDGDCASRIAHLYGE